MTMISSEAGAGTPNDWVLRRTDPGGEEVLPDEDGSGGGPELGFGDLLDVINPLQHLPVVGTIYRALTGDTIGDAARMAGGALYGGPFGIVGALANVVFERENGQDLGDTAMAWLAGDDAGLADSAGAAPATRAEPINAAPVTIAAAHASPAALAANAVTAAPAANAPQAAPVVGAGPGGRGAGATALEERAARASTSFQGRSADRLDAFIQQASAIRRDNPLAHAGRSGSSAAAAGIPPRGVIDPARLQAAILEPPGRADRPKDRDEAGGSGNRVAADAELALAGGDAGSVNEWMLRALDKYEHMRRQEPS